jgi:hypothetical protein
VRNADERESSPGLAATDPDARVVDDHVRDRLEVDLGPTVHETSRKDARVCLDVEPRGVRAAELHREARRAQGGVAAQGGQRAIGVQVTDLEGSRTRRLEEHHAIRPDPSSPRAQSLYRVGAVEAIWRLAARVEEDEVVPRPAHLVERPTARDHARSCDS